MYTKSASSVKLTCIVSGVPNVLLFVYGSKDVCCPLNKHSMRTLVNSFNHNQSYLQLSYRPPVIDVQSDAEICFNLGDKNV